MRILLDECVPARLKAAFAGHSVTTVTESGWRSTSDAPLIQFAERHFDVFVTVDRTIVTQLALRKFRMGIVIARVPKNRLQDFEPIFEELNAAVERVTEGEVVYVFSPLMRKREL